MKAKRSSAGKASESSTPSPEIGSEKPAPPAKAKVVRTRVVKKRVPKPAVLGTDVPAPETSTSKPRKKTGVVRRRAVRPRAGAATPVPAELPAPGLVPQLEVPAEAAQVALQAGGAGLPSAPTRFALEEAHAGPAGERIVQAHSVRMMDPGAPVKAGIPPILFEGDSPKPAMESGPGRRYALGPAPPASHAPVESSLPEAYGTEELLLAARDPHWLYAHWDLTREQQRRYNLLSSDRHLIVRVYADTFAGRPTAEAHVHPESRHWFIHVTRAGTKYFGELGFYAKESGWHRIAVSKPTLTPPDAVSPDTSAQFATIPYEIPLARLVELVKEAALESKPLAAALEELRGTLHPGLPVHCDAPVPGVWTEAQERALAAAINIDRMQRVWMGSLEITELIRRKAAQREEAVPGAVPGSPGAAVGAGISSPVREALRARGFWLNVNAELIIYGSTEPDASVSIGGRPVTLRRDGSFSCRFALPDGQYEITVVAVSEDGTDGRAAELKFSRATEYRGDVGAQAQDPALKSPASVGE